MVPADLSHTPGKPASGKGLHAPADVARLTSPMNARPSVQSKQATRWAGRAIAHLALIAGLLAGGLTSGCDNSSKEKAPPAEIKTVEAYGATLNPAATPQQVAYVLLRSIADDYAAARAKDAKAQQAAQLVTYSLCAPRTIEGRLVQTINLLNPNAKKTSLGDERDERLFKTVHLWGPVVGHYLPSFANADLKTVTRDSWATISADGQQSHVYYPVSHDPAADPAKAETATINVELVREAAQVAGPEYWRVATVRFLGQQILPPAQPVVVLANGLMLDESATPQQVAWVMLQSLAQLIQADKLHAKDLRVSAMYRVFCLSNPAQPRAQMGSNGNTKDADTLALAIKTWVAQVAPNLLTIQTSAVPDKMQVVNNTDGTAEATCPLGSADSAITVQLAQQTASNKAYWRVVGVRALPTAPPVALPAALTTSAPATAPAH
jgi:hypothetical protein